VWRWPDVISIIPPDSNIYPELNVNIKPQMKPTSFALSTNDSYLILCINGQLELCQNAQRKKIVTLYKLEDGKSPANTVHFLPADNNYIIVGLQSGQIMITWVSKSTSWKFDAHNTCVSDIAFMSKDHDSGVVYSASVDGILKQWQLSIIEGKPNLDEKRRCNVSSNISPTYLKVAPDGLARLLVFQQSQVQIWDDKEMLHEWKPPNSNDVIVDACFSAKAQYIYIILSNNFLYISTPTLNLISSIRLNNMLVTTMASHPISINQIAIGTDEGHIWILEVPTEETTVNKNDST
jgi:hypothetical protein